MLESNHHVRNVVTQVTLRLIAYAHSPLPINKYAVGMSMGLFFCLLNGRHGRAPVYANSHVFNKSFYPHNLTFNGRQAQQPLGGPPPVATLSQRHMPPRGGKVFKGSLKDGNPPNKIKQPLPH